ncbi:MAG: YeeE/YedE thiosulfate transporter family protein [Proteobacteria bacterium]|nr:YeeE/YedE thiosulfate transporter family protein [Pseudomonadota bacterium]
MSENRTFGAGLREDYQRFLVESWEAHSGAILLVLLLMALMVKGTFWGVFGGLRLWGDWFNNFIGLGPLLNIKAKLDSPLAHRMSLMNIVLVFGALSAALLSRQFSLYRAPRLEYLWGALGGTLMGIGATLAGGCTTGGFFTPAMASSPAGWTMGVGLMAGAVIGLKLLLWTLEHISWGSQAPPTIDLPLQRAFPLLGLLLILAVVGWSVIWSQGSDERLAGHAIPIVIGFAMGFVMQRSRLCFSRAFREPFMTGEGTMTKAIILALAIGIPAATLIFQKKLIDPYDAIPATFWLGSLSGGALFGIGMVFAGGCASGALWRAGEGHLKLWLALAFFAWSGSTFTGILSHWGVLDRDTGDNNLDFTVLGSQAYLKDLLGSHEAALVCGLGMLLVWYLWVRYNESTEKFTVT